MAKVKFLVRETHSKGHFWKGKKRLSQRKYNFQLFSICNETNLLQKMPQKTYLVTDVIVELPPTAARSAMHCWQLELKATVSVPLALAVRIKAVAGRPSRLLQVAEQFGTAQTPDAVVEDIEPLGGAPTSGG